jgi:hypothetical protein
MCSVFQISVIVIVFAIVFSVILGALYYDFARYFSHSFAEEEKEVAEAMNAVILSKFGTHDSLLQYQEYENQLIEMLCQVQSN